MRSNPRALCMNPQIPYLVAVLEGDVVIDYFFVDMIRAQGTSIHDAPAQHAVADAQTDHPRAVLIVEKEFCVLAADILRQMCGVDDNVTFGANTADDKAPAVLDVIQGYLFRKLVTYGLCNAYELQHRIPTRTSCHVVGSASLSTRSVQKVFGGRGK
eukprot:2393185-Rhodomonas_salina.1